MMHHPASCSHLLWMAASKVSRLLGIDFSANEPRMEMGEHLAFGLCNLMQAKRRPGLLPVASVNDCVMG